MNFLDYLNLASKFESVDSGMFEKRIRINLITNFTDDVLEKILTGICLHHKIYPDIYAVPYKQYQFALKDRQSELYNRAADITFIFFDINYYLHSEFSSKEYLTDVISQVADFAKTGGIIVMNSFVLPYQSPFENLFKQSSLFEDVSRSNKILDELTTNNPSFHVYDVNRIVQFIGEANVRDFRGMYAFDIPFTNDFFLLLAEEWFSYVKSFFGAVKKCIVLDLDNTLWGGVAGEVGAEGIALGPGYPGVAFQNFQRALLGLYNRGIILAINSKNNPEDVKEVFEKNPHMILNEKHFAAAEINWNDKADNLKSISKELNLGMDSFVFLDDDPLNRHIVSSAFPEVLVPEMPVAPEELVKSLFVANFFHQFRITDEDKERGRMYSEEHQRKSVNKRTKNINEYIKELDIKINIECNNSKLLPRLAQLTEKTNQFNLTTKRRSESLLMNILRDKKHFIYSGEVVDRFGHYGIVCLAIIEFENKTAIIDTFLMSCRVMGRGVEYAFLNKIFEELSVKKIEKVEGSYIRTSKNEPARDFLPKMSFMEKHTGEKGVDYVLDLKTYLKNRPKSVANTIKVNYRG